MTTVLAFLCEDLGNVWTRCSCVKVVVDSSAECPAAVMGWAMARMNSRMRRKADESCAWFTQSGEAGFVLVPARHQVFDAASSRRFSLAVCLLARSSTRGDS